MTQQYQMFGIVAPDQNQPVPSVHIRDFGNRKPPLRAAFTFEPGRQPYAAESNTPQQQCEQADQANNEKKRQKKPDVAQIHSRIFSPISRALIAGLCPRQAQNAVI